MATIYNLTNVTNTTNPAAMAIALNQVSNGLLGITLVLTGYFITFIALKGWNNKDAAASSTFGWTIITLLFYLSGFVGEYILLLFVVLSAGAAGFLLKR